MEGPGHLPLEVDLTNTSIPAANAHRDQVWGTLQSAHKELLLEQYNQTQTPGHSRSSSSSSSFVSAMCKVRGEALLRWDDRQNAAHWLLAAVALDVTCIAALNILTDNHLLTEDQEMSLSALIDARSRVQAPADSVQTDKQASSTDTNQLSLPTPKTPQTQLRQSVAVLENLSLNTPLDTLPSTAPTPVPSTHWLSSLLRMRLHRYSLAADKSIHARFGDLELVHGLGHDHDVRVAKAEAFFYQHEATAALLPLQHACAADPTDSRAFLLYCAALVQAGYPMKLYPLAHAAVKNSPKGADCVAAAFDCSCLCCFIQSCDDDNAGMYQLCALCAAFD
jgi:hypothetical protein